MREFKKKEIKLDEHNFEKSKQYPDFELNHKAAKWLYEFWNDKGKVICRTPILFHNPHTNEQGMVYPDFIFVWNDRVEICFNGSKGVVLVTPVSYNLLHVDFKRQCTNALIQCKVLAGNDGNIPSPNPKTVSTMWYNKNEDGF